MARLTRGQVLELVVGSVEGDQLSQLANAGREFPDLVLPQAQHRQILRPPTKQSPISDESRGRPTLTNS